MNLHLRNQTIIKPCVKKYGIRRPDRFTLNVALFQQTKPDDDALFSLDFTINAETW